MNKALLRAYASKMSEETDGRKVSLDEAEAEITRVIMEVARNLSRKAKFGYHTRLDMAQQGAIFALEVLDSGHYDVNRPLEGFLYIHVRNRLANYKRDNYVRSERPCQCCDPFNPPLAPCDKWTAWNNRNLCKQNLMRPLDVYSVADENERNMRVNSDVEEEASINELVALIDQELPVELRSDYLKMKTGVTIPKGRRIRVRTAIMEIMKSNGDEEAGDIYSAETD
jgi:hypothetical protein